MGIFNFIKTAGEKVLGGSVVDAAQKLLGHVQKAQLPAKDLDIVWNEGTVTVRGQAASQADKEKVILALGNVEGVEKVEEEIEVAASAPNPEPPARFYTVVKGDTLSKIAKQFYGDAKLYPRIFEANQPLLKHPDKIYPGQSLRIP